MKVTQNPLPQSSTLENTRATEKAQKARAAEAPSTNVTQRSGQPDADVTISDGAQLLRQAREAVYASPDIQHDKVAELKRRIQSGTYQVDSKAVADKLVDEHLASNFGKNNL